MTNKLTRRTMLGTALAGTALATGVAARPARAATRTLNVLCHKVHQACLTGGPAGDLTKAWREANNVEIAWATFDTNALQDRLFREASLTSTEFGVGYLVNSRATAAAAKLLLPLDDFQAKTPVENIGDIAHGLTAAMTIGGKLIGIPVRHATEGLFYNTALMAERGIKAPPATLEEMVEQARHLTWRDKTGKQTTGMVLASDLSVFPVTFARAFGGDFIGPDLKLVPNPAALEHALAVMQGMYKAHSLPRSYATTHNEDEAIWMLQGRAAFTIYPFARYHQLNDPAQSRYPGKITASEFPMSRTMGGKPMQSVTEFWAMSIPGNAKDKELGWSFIQAMSSPAVTTGAALNGNGPVRLSTYQDAAYLKAQPLGAVEGHALRNARVPLPAFPEAVRAQSIFLEEVQLAVLGQKTPNAAVKNIVSRVTPLMHA
jgi:multiple sugar transport system substrate-binding protein